MKTALILRGLPGAGKTTLAEAIAPEANVAADQWFDRFNEGVFESKYLSEAHGWCLDKFAWMLAQDDEFWTTVAVHNTFTRRSEYQPYIDVAKKLGATVHVITVENPQGNVTTHGVPEQTIDKMHKRFELDLMPREGD